MRAHEMTELFSAAVSFAAFVMTRFRFPRRAPGEQTGGSRFGAMRCSSADRTRRGLSLPSERPGHDPPRLSM